MSTIVRSTKLLASSIPYALAGLLLIGAPSVGYAKFKFLAENSKNGDTMSMENKPKNWVVDATNNWMGDLPDDTEINQISIPGTHDSATYGKNLGIGVKTQTWSVKEQLEAGIRFLDIRVRRTDNSWSLHHGAFYLGKQFGDIMDMVTGFLKQHPSEVVFMHIKNDYDAKKNSKSHAEIWKRYSGIYDRYIVPPSPKKVTLGDIRGKVFVLSQINEVDSSAGKYWPTDDKNVLQNYYKVSLLAHDKADAKTQEATMPAKKRLIKQYIDKARKEPASMEMIFNLLSGSTHMTPQNVADYTNDTAYDYIKHDGKKRTNGVIIMDFPGEKLVYRIIKSNFFKSDYK